MKKVIIFFCIILAIIIIIVGILYFKNNRLSFLNSNIENIENVENVVNIEENGDVENASDISMVIKDGTLTPSGATVVLTNSYAYDRWYRIDKEENGEWKEAETINDNYSFTAEGYLTNGNSEVKIPIDWTDLYGTLENGKYRIVKRVFNNLNREEYVSVEFTID